MIFVTGVAVVVGATVTAIQAQRPVRPQQKPVASIASVVRQAASAPTLRPANAATLSPAQPAARAKTAAKPNAKRPAAAAVASAVAPAAPVAKKPIPLEERFREEMETTARGDGRGGENADRWAKWFYGQRAYPAATTPKGALKKAVADAKKGNGGHGNKLVGLVAIPAWTAIGPSHIPDGQTDTTVGPAGAVSGRVSAIAIDPSDPSKVYVGGAQGGVWKSTNGGSNWTPKSDQEASLAIGDIAIDPVDPNIIYAGTGEPNGSCDSYYGAGVLRSTDGGDSWSLFGSDFLGPFAGQSISKIIIDPSTAGSTTGTTVFASTALGFFSSGTEQCDLAPGAWNGAVWRSTDSGQTWAFLDVPTGAAAPNARIHDMLLDPTNPNVLYVAVRSVPVPANGGVWKTLNAKDPVPTFTHLGGGFPNGAIANPGYRRISLAIGGADAPNVLYAIMENAATSGVWGIFKTTDGGTTWHHLDNGLRGTANIEVNNNLNKVSGPPIPQSAVGHRVILEGDRTRTVVSVNNNGKKFQVDGPALRDKKVDYSIGDYPLSCEGQCFYDMTLAVDPTVAGGASVYVGGNPHAFNLDLSGVPGGHSLWRSDDGGNTWGGISQGDATAGGLHTDDHEVTFDANGVLYNGNDGGVWKSTDKGATWFNLNSDIAITQFQGVALHPSDRAIVLGGTQDNGTNLLNPALATAPVWFHTDFGDGGQSIIDQSNPNRMFHTYFNQSFNFYGPAKTTNGGVDGPGSWPFAGCYFGYGPQYYNGMDPTDDVSFYAPMASHPGFQPNVIYFGSNKVYRSPDPQPTLLQTPSWTAVSPVLTKGVAGDFLSAIAVLPTLVGGKEVVYTGASDGRIEASSTVDASATATWLTLDAAPLPGRFVTDIALLRSDTTGNTAYVTFSGFNVVTPSTPGHVFKTTNGLTGATWTDVSGDLPDVPVNSIAIVPNGIYIGTDIGVFFSNNDGTNWTFANNGMPNVSVFGIRFGSGSGNLVAATHGRGMFSLAGLCSSGDANGDGSVGIIDVFYLINYIFAHGPGPICGSGDADGNGSVDISDVFYLINFIFAHGPPPV